MCVCHDIGMFKLFWKIKIADGIYADYMFIVPCAQCNLPSYSLWIVKNHTRLARIHPNLVKQETVVAV